MPATTATTLARPAQPTEESSRPYPRVLRHLNDSGWRELSYIVPPRLRESGQLAFSGVVFHKGARMLIVQRHREDGCEVWFAGRAFKMDDVLAEIDTYGVEVDL